MCEKNATASVVSAVMLDDGYCPDGDLSKTGEVSSLLVSFLRTFLLSSALPGLLTLLSWLLWLTYYASRRSKASQLPLPPGSMGLPLIGETLTFFLMGATFYRKRRKLYGDVYKTHLLGCPIVRVVGASNVKKVLMGENTLVTPFWPTSVRMMLGLKTLSMSTGERHRFLRRGVAKAFNHRALSGFVSPMQGLVRHYLSSWCQTSVVNGYRESRSLTFAIACRVLVGLEHATRADNEKMLDVFETFTDNLFSLPFNLPGCGLSKGLRARKILLEKIEERIRVKQEQQTSEVTSSDGDALRLMMQLGDEDSRLSVEELQEVCLELLFAGHSTVASSFTSLLYYLGRNPRVVQTVLKELEEHNLLDSDAGDLSFDVLSRLTYVGHVIKETLRLAPPVGAGFRKALKTFEVDGYQVPQGWTVVYSIRETHRFSDLFADADTFRPERWEQDISPGDDKFHFLPFGKGARSCAGKEYAKLLLKVLTVELCRSCHWRLLNEHVQLRFLPVPHPADGLPMQVTPRPAHPLPLPTSSTPAPIRTRADTV